MALRTAAATALTILLAALPLLQPLDDQPARQHDLRQIARVIEQHEWALRQSPRRMAAFRRLAAHDVRLAAQPMPDWRYFGLAASLIASVGNPHTLIWPDTEERDYLPLSFYWASDGLVTVPVAGSPKAVGLGDRVLAIGGRTPAALARALGRYTPGSGYDVRFTATEFSLLAARYSLQWLGVVDRQGQVPITLADAHDRVEHLRLPFVDWPDYPERVGLAQAFFVDRFIAPPGVPVTMAPYGWRVVPRRYGVFWLRSFDPSRALDRSIAGFFAAVGRGNPPDVVIDLQQDTGGDAYIGQAFIDELLARQNVSRRVYVLTDWGSFSASVLFAETVLEDGIGQTVGQPTGEDLEVQGAQDFTEPETGIWFQSAVTEPMDPLGREAGALYPSIRVPLTVRDIQDGVNAVADWLATLGAKAAH